MNIFRVKTTIIDGFEGDKHVSYSYRLEEDGVELKDDTYLTQEDVMEADVAYLEYNTYEFMGLISQPEIDTLKLFKVL
jgi:hypothetical protein